MTWNTNKIANILGGLSFIAVLVNFYFDDFRHQTDLVRQARLDSLQYAINSQTFRPQLQLRGLPTIDLAILKSSGKVITPIDPNNLPPPGSTIDVEYSLSIRMNFVLSNVGNHLAAVMAVICTDTMSYRPHLRDLVLAGEINNWKVNSSLNPQFLEILSLDSSQFTIETQLIFVKNEADTLHCLIFYQNDLGNVYDTYLWVPLKVGQVYYDYVRIPGTDSVQVIRTPGDVRKLIQVSGKPIQSFQSYSAQNALKIKDNLGSFNK